MAIFDEGYIKFNIHWQKGAPPVHGDLPLLLEVRNRLFGLGLIGEYPNGIGFGNISIRADRGRFIITGTQTGGIAKLEQVHVCMVDSCDASKNVVYCSGPVKASSESLTHDAFYKADNFVQAVIHVHHAQLWNRLLNKVPTTDQRVFYGTPEMAAEIKRLITGRSDHQHKIIITAGHEEGIFTYGSSLTAALDELMHYFDELEVN